MRNCLSIEDKKCFFSNFSVFFYVSRFSQQARYTRNKNKFIKIKPIFDIETQQTLRAKNFKRHKFIFLHKTDGLKWFKINLTFQQGRFKRINSSFLRKMQELNMSKVNFNIIFYLKTGLLEFSDD